MVGLSQESGEASVAMIMLYFQHTCCEVSSLEDGPAIFPAQ